MTIALRSFRGCRKHQRRSIFDTQPMDALSSQSALAGDSVAHVFQRLEHGDVQSRVVIDFMGSA